MKKKSENIFFLFCSPHEYYLDNLIPISKELSFRKIKHSLVFIDKNNKEKIVSNYNASISLNDFFKKKYKVNNVILTQNWWLNDKKVSDFCKKEGIDLYVVEHAPQMLEYIDGKIYRDDISNAKFHAMWGINSKNIMDSHLNHGRLPIFGAPRLERAIYNFNPNILKIKKYMADNRKIILICTTSQRMMSFDINNKISELSKKINFSKYKILVKNHPKGPKINFDNKNIFYFDESSKLDFEIIYYSNKIIFCFPSSLMIIGSLFEKNMYSLYKNHSNLKVTDYYNKHKSLIKDSDLLFEKTDNDKFYILNNNFLINNLYIDKKTTPSKEIINFILKR